MVEHCHQSRFVFNIGLEQRAMWSRNKHTRSPELNTAKVNVASQMRELTLLRQELDWLAAGASVVQQAALRDLDRAFANFSSPVVRSTRRSRSAMNATAASWSVT